jgi:translocator protein
MKKETTQRATLLLNCTAWIVICLIISGLSGWVTQANIQSWYIHLQKPSFNPPNWLFGPVWTVLYIMIGISGGILWGERKKNSPAFYCYLLQLILNFAWSFIFFGAHLIGWALADIVAIMLTTTVTVILSFKRTKIAAYLLTPYLAWIIFALTLNAALWHLN